MQESILTTLKPWLELKELDIQPTEASRCPSPCTDLKNPKPSSFWTWANNSARNKQWPQVWEGWTLCRKADCSPYSLSGTTLIPWLLQPPAHSPLPSPPLMEALSKNPVLLKVLSLWVSIPVSFLWGDTFLRPGLGLLFPSPVPKPGSRYCYGHPGIPLTPACPQHLLCN